MKLNYDIVIDRDLDSVWKAFDNPDNLRRWQPTLESFERLAGEPGKPGTVSRLVYVENGRRIEMTETISERRAPHFLAGLYDSAMGSAIVVNHFADTGGGRTRWTMYWNHRTKGWFRLLAPFVHGAMKKRVEADLNRFKLFAESDSFQAARRDDVVHRP